MEWNEYNTYMDTHMAFFAGMVNNGDFIDIKTFQNKIIRKGYKFLVRGRNQFESFVILLPQSSIIVQILWINAERKWYPEVFDAPVPGCFQVDRSYDKLVVYEEMIKNGSTFAEVAKYSQEHTPSNLMSDGTFHPGVTAPPGFSQPFQLCARPNKPMEYGEFPCGTYLSSC